MLGLDTHSAMKQVLFIEYHGAHLKFNLCPPDLMTPFFAGLSLYRSLGFIFPPSDTKELTDYIWTCYSERCVPPPAVLQPMYFRVPGAEAERCGIAGSDARREWGGSAGAGLPNLAKIT